MSTVASVILTFWHVFGTATCISPLLAAYSRTSGWQARSRMTTHFRRSQPLNCSFERVGRLGLEPRTGGL